RRTAAAPVGQLPATGRDRGGCSTDRPAPRRAVSSCDMTGNYARRALEVFASYGDTEALVAADGRRFTFGDMHDAIRDTAAALWQHGIRPGTTIGLLVTNSPESFFVQLAAHLIGCRTVFMVTNTPWVFLREVLPFVEADALVYEADTVGQAVGGADDLVRRRRLRPAGGHGHRRDPRHHRPGTHHQHPHLAAAAVPAARRPPAGRRRPEHPAVADDLLRRRVTGTPGRGGEVVRPLPQRGVRHERAPDDQYLPGHRRRPGPAGIVRVPLA